MNTQNERRIFPKATAVLILIVLMVSLVAVWRMGLLGELSNKDQLILLLRNEGLKGPLFCVAAQFLQVVIFIIPGEITQFAAGYVFGAWRGLLYSAIGILLGSAFNFYLARFVGRPGLRSIISPATLARVDAQFAKARTKSAMFLLFLLPGAPKDILCYGAGFSHMSLSEFLVISGLGRLPALFASILVGSRVYHRDLISLSIIALVVAGVILGYYFYERRRRNSRSN